MTSKETIIKTFALLKANYQNSLKDYSKQEMQLAINAWYEFFKDIPEIDFNRAIKNIISKCDFFPTISQVKREIADNQTQNFPSAEDEWEKVIKAVHRYGTYRQKEALDSLKPYTRYITSHIGYQIICMSEDNTWNRKEFIDEYNHLKDKEKELIQIGTSNFKLLESIE